MPGDETVTLPAKLTVGVTSLGILGLKIPTACATVEPVAFNFADTLTPEELEKGWQFSGKATVPYIACKERGLFGALFGLVLSGLLSGPENAYSIKISEP